MGNSIVHSQSIQAEQFLASASAEIDEFLNRMTLAELLEEEPAGDEAYYRGLLATLRRLTVFAEEGLDACHVVLKDENFRKNAAEKTLYWIYHQVIEEFFSPRHDYWTENSRAAYTGKNSISFPETAPPSIVTLLTSLEASFQEMREELEYYETDFKTKMLQSNKDSESSL